MVIKTIEKNICDVCDINEVHTYGDTDNVIHNFVCPYCEKELCKACIVIVKLIIKELDDVGARIIPSQNITLCKECFKNYDFDINILKK